MSAPSDVRLKCDQLREHGIEVLAVTAPELGECVDEYASLLLAYARAVT
ncbi:hypothetical protein [Sporichthya polymorpha]|nr:hypothetical protein [Sporichthya polymorpha]